MNVIKKYTLSFPQQDIQGDYDFTIPVQTSSDIIINMSNNYQIQLTSGEFGLALVNMSDFTIVNGGDTTTSAGIYYGFVGGLNNVTIKVPASTVSQEGTIDIKIGGV